MKPRPGIFAAAVAAAVLVAALIFLLKSGNGKKGHTPLGESSAGAVVRLDPPTTMNGAGIASSSVPDADSVSDKLEQMLANLLNGSATDADLAALREYLLGLDSQEAAAAIQAFLESGRDAGTRQNFTVGPGGTLIGAPTFRTFLLDVLGEIGRKTTSSVALPLSRQILETKKSPDEWALALRNVGWADPRAKPYLASKFREMLAHEPWTSDPSDGFLEAFDVAVFSGDPAFIPRLSELLNSSNDALTRAAAVALDRLSEMKPLEVMTHLNANPNEFADRPFLRADFFAKANFTDPAQRAALETYLSRPDVAVPEKTKLLEALALPASFVSDNLLTQSALPEEDDSGARQQQLAALLTDWQTRNRFPELRQEIGLVQGRLGR